MKKTSDEDPNEQDDALDPDAVDEPLGDGLDLEVWDAQLPSAGFAERVLSRVREEERAVPAAAQPKRVRRWGVITASAAALAIAAAMLVGVGGPPPFGEAIAKDRIEVAIGARALAVLESGASVRWDGDDVTQSRGDVFYRVEPGKRFTVHTPAGDVEVKGTCFTVKVRAKETNKEDSMMQKRDVKSGLVGGALAALAFVAVYEGKVAVSHASEHASLGAGESAQIGPGGVRKTGATSDGEKDFNANVAAQAADEPLSAANQRLVRQVGEYRSRLESIAAQKADVEEKLKRSEANLAASQDGAPVLTKPEFDLSQDDWKELAKEGTMKYQMPCLSGKGEPWTPSADKLNALGLSPQDGAALKDAYAQTNQRVWGVIRPLCVSEVGSAELADRMGPDTCIRIIESGESERAPKGGDGAMKKAIQEVAEMRAGIRPMPGPNDAPSPLVKLFLATTGANKAFEGDLAKSFGPEEAHRLAYSDELCAGRHVHSEGDGKKKRK